MSEQYTFPKADDSVNNLYAKGRSLLEKGLTENAFHIFQQGLTAGNPKCAYGLFVCSLQKDEEICTYAKLLDANIEAICLMAEHDGESCFIIGRCYETGCCYPESMKEAYNYYVKAADFGNPDAMYNLGCMCANNGNIGEAVSWFTKASANGVSEAQHYLRMLSQSE